MLTSFLQLLSFLSFFLSFFLLLSLSLSLSLHVSLYQFLKLPIIFFFQVPLSGLVFLSCTVLEHGIDHKETKVSGKVKEKKNRKKEN